MMRRRMPTLTCAFVIGLLSAVTAENSTPSLLRLLLGLAMIFLMPGYATVAAALPGRDPGAGSRLLASLGVSLVISTCTAVGLAAAPIGLSKGSLAIALGAATCVLSVFAVLRAHRFDMGDRSAVSRDLPRVLVVGAGTRFLSAMSYYTRRLSNALAAQFDVDVIEMRQMIPTSMYPGSARVGLLRTRLNYADSVTVLPGVDWYWLPNLLRDINTLRKSPPNYVIFEWWTGTVLHTYLALALVSRMLGAHVIVECHEVLDSSEDRIPLARAWVRLLGRPFFRLASAFVVHSDADREPLDQRYGLRGRPCILIHHGPFDHHVAAESELSALAALAEVPHPLNLLYFGIIRPYKGLEDLIDAFDLLDDDEVNGYWLTVVGETWDGWDVPAERIKANRHRDRITRR
jgi:Protein of unknown function (DUF1616)/Glycosyltransferase Family 4